MPDRPKRGRPRKPPRLHPESLLTYLRDDPEDPRYALCRCRCKGLARVLRRKLTETLSCGCARALAAKKALDQNRKSRWA